MDQAPQSGQQPGTRLSPTQAAEPLILPDSESCKRLQRFLKSANPDLGLIPCDSIPDGIKGALAFDPKKDGDELWFGWRFAQPVKETIVVEGDKMAETLGRCLDDREWITADDPKKLRFGFVNYRLSKWLLFSIHSIKAATSANPSLDAKMRSYSEARKAGDLRAKAATP